MQTKRQVDCNVHCFTGWLPGKKLCRVKNKENTGAITGTHTEALNLTEKQDQLCLLLFTALSPTESSLHSQVISESCSATANKQYKHGQRAFTNNLALSLSVFVFFTRISYDSEKSLTSSLPISEARALGKV